MRKPRNLFRNLVLHLPACCRRRPAGSCESGTFLRKPRSTSRQVSHPGMASRWSAPSLHTSLCWEGEPGGCSTALPRHLACPVEWVCVQAPRRLRSSGRTTPPASSTACASRSASTTGAARGWGGGSRLSPVLGDASLGFVSPVQPVPSVWLQIATFGLRRPTSQRLLAVADGRGRAAPAGQPRQERLRLLPL